MKPSGTCPRLANIGRAVCSDMRAVFVGLAGLFLLVFATSSPAADRDGLAHFENEIRPLLVARCVECHGPKKAESSLRLDSWAGVQAGGDRGPAVVPGKPDESWVIKAVEHSADLKMPPEKKLEPRQVAALRQWIAAGAVWPEGAKLAGGGIAVRSGPITSAERRHWSLQPIADPQPPAARSSSHEAARHPVDLFLAAKLRDAKLTPTPPADRRVLIRRVTLDLTGLPPTGDEIDAFLRDDSPDAFARLVDRLLASPAYGERWGRHWLDVVRYADTAGETADYPTPLAYKYRNWVLAAFNADKPYDVFVREQLAGDLVARDTAGITAADYRERMIATGYLAISRRFGFDVENYHHLTIQDTIDNVGQTFLGLSLGCARCHDHKFDPVDTADYYGWYGIFASTRYSFPGSEEKKRPYDLFPVVPPAEATRAKTDHDAKLTKLDATLKSLGDEKQSGDAFRQARAQRDVLAQAGPYEVVYGAVDQDKPAHAKIQIRGDRLKFGAEVPRKNLALLGGESLSHPGSGRRDLAAWLTRAENPLLARVMVNRIWQHHFGRGLVGTENDFGARGERPSHPELLDWLASRFRENGYSVKSLHRVMLSSAAYQRSSAWNSQAAQVDPDARLLWRFPPRRLSAEEIRDAMLLASGSLDRSQGGEHPFPPVATWGFTQHDPFYGVYATRRRSVYLMQQRIKRQPFLGLFDGADANVSTPRRELTTVPTQALYLMNNEFVQEQAAGVARRVLTAAAAPQDRIVAAYRLTLGRDPDSAEEQAVARFLAEYRAVLTEINVPAGDREPQLWSGLARTLLTRNEFLFVD